MPDPTPRYQTGDVNWCTVSPDTFNWGYTFTDNDVRFSTPVVGGPDPADSGNDVIYAGAGADHVWAGARAIKGLSFAFNSEPPCHAAYALN